MLGKKINNNTDEVAGVFSKKLAQMAYQRGHKDVEQLTKNPTTCHLRA